MTLEQAKQLYTSQDPDASLCESDWVHVHREMEEVVSAKSDREAAKVIEWWSCWDRYFTATRFAHRLRKEWERMNEKTINK